MYRHILVPLDGSHLAEQILTHVKALASLEGSEAHITLFRAVPPIYPATVDYSGMLTTMMDTLPEAEQEAQDYLDTIAAELKAEGYKVQCEVSVMPAAEGIIEFSEAHRVDLIAIATHGRSGISRWVFGSVTQKVIHSAQAPLLVMRPKEH